MKTDYFGHNRRYQQLRVQGATGWDTPDIVRRNIALLQRRLEKPYLPRQGRLLELGCGAGNISLWLAQQGYEVSGIDIAPTAVAWAQEKAAQQGINADFRVGNVCDMIAYADASFDIVLDGHCLHCIIGEDRARFFAEARRVLKPGGYLLILTMCNDPGGDPVPEWYDPVSRCQVYGDIVVRYFGEPDVLQQEIVTAGFRIVHTELIPRPETNGTDSLLIDAQRETE